MPQEGYWHKRGYLKESVKGTKAIGWELALLPLLTAPSMCPLFPFSMPHFPKLAIHTTKKSDPQAKLFTVFYESLKGRGAEKEKGWIGGQRGGGLLQSRSEERGGERKRRQACMRVPSGAKPRRKGCLGMGREYARASQKRRKSGTGAMAEIEVQMDFGYSWQGLRQREHKGVPGEGTGSEELGSYKRAPEML